jgi:hypothetical protein
MRNNALSTRSLIDRTILRLRVLSVDGNRARVFDSQTCITVDVGSDVVNLQPMCVYDIGLRAMASPVPLCAVQAPDGTPTGSLRDIYRAIPTADVFYIASVAPVLRIADYDTRTGDAPRGGRVAVIDNDLGRWDTQHVRVGQCYYIAFEAPVATMLDATLVE